MYPVTPPAESVPVLWRAAQTVRVAAGRAQGMIGFLAIFAAALSGYAGIGIWAVAASALALAALSQAQYGEIYQDARDRGHSGAAFETVLSSLMNSVLAAGGAYTVGVFLRLL